MSTPSESSEQASAAAAPRWLLLLYQLPPKPDYLRVKLRRRLLGLGAAPLKHAAYVLPNTDACLEDFQWLRREIEGDGGEASVCAVAILEGLDDAELIRQFRRQRDREYQTVARQAAKLGARATRPEVDRLRRRIAAIGKRDFFQATQRAEAERAVDRLELRRETAPPGTAEAARPLTPPPRKAVWVTRRDVHIDRIASAWLIRRFIDPGARFRFVPPTGARIRKGELRFDTFEGEFTHDADRCTFETLLHRFDLRDPALAWIGEVVHDLDCKDDKFGHGEAGGIATVLEGLCAARAADADRLEAGAAVFDALYARMRDRTS